MTQMMSGWFIIKKRNGGLLNILVPDVELLSGIHVILLEISSRAVSDKRESGFHLRGAAARRTLGRSRVLLLGLNGVAVQGPGGTCFMAAGCVFISANCSGTSAGAGSGPGSVAALGRGPGFARALMPSVC